MKKSEYQAKVLSLRLVRDRTQLVSERQIALILGRAHDDLTRLMALSGEGSVTRKNYEMRRGEIKKALGRMTDSISMTMRLGMKNAAEDTADQYFENAEKFVGDRGRLLDFADAYAAVPALAMKNTINRLWADGQNFSDRIWNLNKYAEKAIDDVVAAAVARGESAIELSKDIQKFLVSSEVTPGTSWTTAIKKSKTGAGTINYNALRLARTEINNSYREALVLSNHENPITLGVKWNLSKSHPRPDICDVWAAADLYGLGAGVYPPEKTPLDHPNGMCYLTDVLRPSDQWDLLKPRTVRQDVGKDEILEPMAGMDEQERVAAWKQFTAIERLVGGQKRKAA
jgi:hypothetical protein